MSAFRIFLTEARRSLKLNLSLFVCLFILGFALSSMFTVKRQIESLVAPVLWDADIIILPKGVSLDGLHRSLITGMAEGFIPLALFETLETQVYNSPLKVLGFVPYKEAGAVKIGLQGGAADFPFTDEAVWSALEKTARKDIADYQTAEWGQKVLGGILVRGPKIALENLKTMIDRRTVAQAWYVNSEMSDDVLRMTQMRKGLEAFTALIVLALAPGLVLSVMILSQRLTAIFTVLDEVGAAKAVKPQLIFCQALAWAVLPCLLGILFSLSLSSVWLQILR